MATNSILLFGGSATNILSQVAYAASTGRTAGHVPGEASSQLENKALKQASLMAAGVAQFIADNQSENIADTLTVQNIADYLQDAIEALQIAVPDATESVKGIMYLASALQAQNWISGLYAITPATLYSALQGANQSLVANNGFQVWPGGLIDKWGYTDVTAEGSGTTSRVTVNFSPAFPNACFYVNLQQVQSAGAVAENMVPYLGGNPTKTGFTCGLDTHGGPTGPYRVYWTARGN